MFRDGCWRGGASASREVRRCSRDEISPHRQRGPRAPELSSHHAAEPGVDTNGVVPTECLGHASPIRTQRRARRPRTRGLRASGRRVGGPGKWATSQVERYSPVREFSHRGPSNSAWRGRGRDLGIPCVFNWP
ncbi:hypothetical protein CVT30_37140 [Streptomyces sp. AMCC400023]|nr:hypothetical protein CVT30_37140 [Streptomyces sp. AMCC400023]